MLKVSVIIPIYRDIDDFEIISLKQCLKVLGHYDCILVCPIGLDTTQVHKLANQYSLREERFDKKFFINIEGYNQLMLSYEFYSRFYRYDYILIYQLDAYVFRDELMYWCEEGYDYIGAPWLTDYKSAEQGGVLWKVGNGGFSLRKISTMCKIFEPYKPLLSFRQLLSLKQNMHYHSNRLRDIITSLIRSLGYKNSISFFKKNYKENEDVFISQYLGELGIILHIPDPNEAIYFAFENSPSYLFKLTNDNLPFGCHAWRRYEYQSFWKKHIVYD